VFFSSEPIILGLLTIYVFGSLGSYFAVRAGYPAAARGWVIVGAPIVVFAITSIYYPSGDSVLVVSARIVLLTGSIAPFLVLPYHKRWLTFLALTFNMALLCGVDYGVVYFPIKSANYVPNSLVSRLISSITTMLYLSILTYSFRKGVYRRNADLIRMATEADKLQHDREQMARDLSLQKEQLSELNDNKNRFFGLIAHDLRTPINSFKGYSRILIDHIDELSHEEIKDMTISMRMSFEHVRTLLDNLLSWSRSQMNLVEYRPQEVDLKGLFHSVVATFDANLEEKDLRIDVDIEELTTVYTDPNLLSAVLRNLISNAIKFSTPMSRIKLIATRMDAHSVRLSIRDFGVGMPKAKIDALFKIEHKISTLGTANEKGTGLGLILSNDFLQKMGTSFEVESAPGLGSMFSFTLRTA
jgi:signal transduction histidine kinase